MAEAGRLAMRVEGDDWVAYFALPTSMDGALRLGSVRMAIVQDPGRKQAFVDLMKSYVGDVLAKFGEQPRWKDPVGAPETERS